MAFKRNTRSQEADIHVLLSAGHRQHRCSEAFVNDLCDRVQYPAMAELDRLFGPNWARVLEPSLVLQGPALGFRLTVVQVGGWTVSSMATEINRVFNEHWDREVDRIPPR